MPTRIVCVLLMLVLLAGLPAVVAAQAGSDRNLVATPRTAQRVALVVGNAQYRESPLRNPVNDAQDMAAVLRGLGFEVIEKYNASQREMNRALSQFGARLGPESVALFYYSGHGLQVSGKNFLIPVDAEIAAEAAVHSEAVDVDALFAHLRHSPVNIVILDACRNNPFERGFRSSGGGGLAPPLDAPKGTLIAYATAPGRTAADGSGRNSPYTRELLDALKLPGLPVQEVFNRVRAGVLKNTGNQQQPWELTSLTGSVYFNGAPSAANRPATATPAFGEAERDEELWASLPSTPTRLHYIDYLYVFPSGRHAQFASGKVAGRWLKDPATGCSIWWPFDGQTVTGLNGCTNRRATGEFTLNVQAPGYNWAGKATFDAGLLSGPADVSIRNPESSGKQRGSYTTLHEGRASLQFEGTMETQNPNGSAKATMVGKMLWSAPPLAGTIMIGEVNLKTAVTRSPRASAEGSAGRFDRRCVGRCRPATLPSGRALVTAPQQL